MKVWVVHFETIGVPDRMKRKWEVNYVDTRRNYLVMQTDEKVTNEEIMMINGVLKAKEQSLVSEGER